jgi:hypothetical protein
MSEYIKCVICGIEKVETEFYVDRRNKSGRFSKCILCCCDYDREKWIKKHNNSNDRGPGKHERNIYSEIGLFWCSGCRQWLRQDLFYTSKYTRFGFSNHCRCCTDVDHKLFLEKNPNYGKTYRNKPLAKYNSYMRMLSIEKVANLTLICPLTIS